MSCFLNKIVLSFICTTVIFLHAPPLKSTDNEQQPPSKSLIKGCESLSYEIWSTIFQYYKAEEIQLLRQVCKKFLSVSRAPPLWHGKKITFLPLKQEQYVEQEQSSIKIFSSWSWGLKESFKSNKNGITSPLPIPLEELQCPIESLKADFKTFLWPEKIKRCLQFQTLKELTLTGDPPMTFQHFETILLFSNLQILRFSAKTLKEISLFDEVPTKISLLTQLTILQCLEIPDNNLGAAGVKPLGNITTLTFLNLRDNIIKDEGLQSLASLSHLVVLNIQGNAIGEGIRILTGLSDLQTLNLHNNDIQDKDLTLLCSLPKLSNLALGSNFQLTAYYSQVLAQMTNLTRLTVYPDILVRKVNECTILTSLRLLKETDLFWNAPPPSLEEITSYFPEFTTLIIPEDKTPESPNNNSI